jgi:hypothetical protein
MMAANGISITILLRSLLSVFQKLMAINKNETEITVRIILSKSSEGNKIVIPIRTICIAKNIKILDIFNLLK